MGAAVVGRDGTGLASLRGPDVLLAVEVADSSLDYDVRRKPLVYARFGVRELWVIETTGPLEHRIGMVEVDLDIEAAVREAKERLDG